MMVDKFTLQGALQYEHEGREEEWVHQFLTGAGHNPFLSYIMGLKKRYFIGPVVFGLSALTRNCGPEENMKYRVKQPGFEFMVGSMMASFANGWDMPPLIVEYDNGRFDLSDGNHRYEALKKLNIPQYHVVFWTSSLEDLEKLQELIAPEQNKQKTANASDYNNKGFQSLN